MPELTAEEIAAIQADLDAERAYRDSLRTALRQVSDNGGADFVQITTPSGHQRTVRYNAMQLQKLVGAANIRINKLGGQTQGKDWQSTQAAPTYRSRPS